MICFGLFLLLAAAVAAAVIRLGGGVGLAALCFMLSFLLAHVLYVLGSWLLSRGVDLSQPGAKQSPVTRWGVAQVGQLLCLYGGVRPVIRGVEKFPAEGNFLFVCNHRSMFDPLIVMGCLPRQNIAFISKPSNMAIPIVGSAARTAGFLSIDRENDREALKTILTAVDYLKRGICSIGIYPEGTRSHTTELLPFHAGSFKIAQRAKVPLVIACVHGTEKLRRFHIAPRRCWLDILETVPAETVASMRTAELAAYCRERMETFLKEADKA